MKKTKSLQSILEAFDQSNTALSGVELTKRFQSKMNKTTVYRILDRLEKEKHLHSFTDLKGLRWYAKTLPSNTDKDSNVHSHFQCNACGISKCLPIEVELPAVANHKIDSASFILVGQCQDCLV